MLDLEEQNLRAIGDDKAHYSSYPPSLAVDGKQETVFRSLLSMSIRCRSSHYSTGAAQGDTMILDMLRDVSTLYSNIQITLFVDNATEHILRACTFETSLDGIG